MYLIEYSQNDGDSYMVSNIVGIYETEEEAIQKMEQIMSPYIIIGKNEIRRADYDVIIVCAMNGNLIIKTDPETSENRSDWIHSIRSVEFGEIPSLAKGISGTYRTNLKKRDPLPPDNRITCSIQ